MKKQRVRMRQAVAGVSESLMATKLREHIVFCRAFIQHMASSIKSLAPLLV